MLLIFKEMICLALSRLSLQQARSVRQWGVRSEILLPSHIHSAYCVSTLIACLDVAGNGLEGPLPTSYCNVTSKLSPIKVECGGALEEGCGCCRCISTSVQTEEDVDASCQYEWAESQDAYVFDRYNVSGGFWDY